MIQELQVMFQERELVLTKKCVPESRYMGVKITPKALT